MNITIQRDSRIPVYLQIENQIRSMILSGALPPGFPLPPERRFAETLGVNRSTVLNAYRELKADGFIGSQVGKGTVVLSHKAPDYPGVENPAALQWQQMFSERTAKVKEPLLRDLMELTSREEIISFAAGIPAPDLYPMDTLREIQCKVIEECGPSILMHTPSEGYHSLRESISRLLGKKNIAASTEEILILSGSQQGLDLAARAFIDPGDVVIVEQPSFFSALQVFTAAGARLMGVPVDENGMRVDLLEPMLSRYRPKLIYTLPTYQNPSGAVMSLDRRKQLLDLAYKYQVPILEDDPYSELRYEGDALPSLKSLDPHGYVLYLSTFSKMLFPGLRVGWLAASRSVVRQFTLLKGMMDLHSSSLAQHTMDRFLRMDLLEGHIRTVRKHYSHRRDVMLQELAKRAPKGVEWSKPAGGLYIWCKLPEEILLSRLLVKASEQDVAFVPGDVCFIPGQQSGYMRLNFSCPDPEKIKEGIKKLMRAVNECTKGPVDKEKGEKGEFMPIV